MALLSPIFNETHFKSDGTLASGYKIYTYIADSDIAATTYTTEDGDVAQANPIILNSRGELDNPIWLSDGTKYKFIFTSNVDVVIKTIDNIIGVSTPDAIQDQWIEFIGTATYISSNSFSLDGDQASIFDKGRALKLLTSGGTVYANVSTSVFGALTTVTVGQATGLLDTGLTGTKPSYGMLSGTNPAIPAIVEQKIQNQTGFSGTTTGTATALVFTPSLAYQTPNVAKQAASLTLHVALTGGAVTLQAAGQAALPLVNQDGTNPVTPINYIARVESNGTQWVIANSTVASSTTQIGIVELATTAETAARTDTSRAVTPSSLQGILVSGTAIATTSGTSHNFGSIPSWAKRITVSLAGVSISGTSDLMIQIGDSGGIETTGYISTVMSQSGATASSTAGFRITNNVSAAAVVSGHAILTLLDQSANLWALSSTTKGATTTLGISGGDKALSATLTQITLTTVNGTDTFDAGSVNILYE